MNSRTMHIGGLTFSITALHLDDGGYTTTVVESSVRHPHQGAETVKREAQLRHATMTEALDAGESIIRSRLRRKSR